ncbi:hypothetical protein ACFLV2_01370 [Chloroflexota bacterium]
MVYTSRICNCGSNSQCVFKAHVRDGKVVREPDDPKRPAVVWDSRKALELWQRRVAPEGESLPDIYPDISAVTGAPGDIVGRHRLALRARDNAEQQYYTTDNE